MWAVEIWIIMSELVSTQLPQFYFATEHVDLHQITDGTESNDIYCNSAWDREDRIAAYQETVDILRPTHQHGEVAQLLSQSKEHLILIIDGVWRSMRQAMRELALQQYAGTSQLTWDIFNITRPPGFSNQGLHRSPCTRKTAKTL